VSLIARHLEAAGTPTLCMASAHDIITAGNPPRAVFVDFPLGHTTGRPFAADEHYAITRAGLEALAGIDRPGAVMALDHVWSKDEDWKHDAADASMGDQRQPRDTTPRYQTPEDQLAAEGA
jgi:hypothetical protein